MALRIVAAIFAVIAIFIVHSASAEFLEQKIYSYYAHDRYPLVDPMKAAGLARLSVGLPNFQQAAIHFPTTFDSKKEAGLASLSVGLPDIQQAAIHFPTAFGLARSMIAISK